MNKVSWGRLGRILARDRQQAIAAGSLAKVAAHMRIVHVLVAGRPKCGFTTDLPKDWPVGHVWVQAGDPAVTCGGCLEDRET